MSMSNSPSPSTTPEYDTFDYPPSDDAVRVVVIFLGTLHILFAMVMTSILYFRRHHRMLRPRTPPVLMAYSIFLCFQVALNATSFISGKALTCYAMDFMYLMMAFFSSIFAMAPFNLYILSETHKLKHEYAETKNRVIWKLERLVTQLRWRVLFSVLLLAIICGLYMGIKQVVTLPGDCSRFALVVSSAVILLFVAICLPANFYVIKNLDDPYYWRVEMALYSLFGAPASFCFFLYAWVPSIFYEGFDFRWVNLYLAFVPNLFVITFPVLLTFPFVEKPLRKLLSKKETPTDVEMAASKTEKFLFSLSKIDELQAILDNQVLREALIAFCGSQWCMENVLFIQDVTTFKSEYEKDSTASKELAKKIINEYVTRGGPLEINISSRLRRDTIEAYHEELTSTIFNALLVEIKDIVKTDTLGKWHETKEFKEALKRAVVLRNSGSGSNSHSGLEISLKTGA